MKKRDKEKRGEPLEESWPRLKRREGEGTRELGGGWKIERQRYGTAYVHFYGEGSKQSPARITLRAWRDVIHLVVNATRSVPIKGSWSLLSPPEQSVGLIQAEGDSTMSQSRDAANKCCANLQIELHVSCTCRYTDESTLLEIILKIISSNLNSINL